MLEILAVEPGSIAEELELVACDVLLKVNGEVINDLVDYQVLTAVEDLILDVRRHDGEFWEIPLEKDADDLLGLYFEHPDPTCCGNDCLFCFVHQLPKGMRRTLYVKDEDFRFSYLYGAYVTLSNIGEEEVARIIRQKLSPLYVSVHASDETLRARLLGRQGLPVLPLLQRLVAAGIDIHTQIVVCPGINDGAVLWRTVDDLYALAPGIRSLAIVPVGLTGHRQNLPVLRTPTVEEAKVFLEVMAQKQQSFLAASGSRFLFAADEWYLKAQEPFPPLEEYEALEQLENGVGMIPLFRAETTQALPMFPTLEKGLELSTFTGRSAQQEIEALARELKERCGITLRVYPVDNHFFGGEVTVTGLLTGADVVAQLRDRPLGEVLLVPEVVLREGEAVFLDDFPLQRLSETLGVKVKVVGVSPWELLEILDELAEGEA